MGFKSNAKVPKTPTTEYLRELRFKDFRGELSDEEIPLAKKYGILRFDLYEKSKKMVPKEKQLEVSRAYHQGRRLAPQFGPGGKPLRSVAPPGKERYLIRSYEDLEILLRDERADGPGR